MSRFRLAGALGALLLCLPFALSSAAQSGVDSSGTSTDCIHGRARGAWDLPVLRDAGRIEGLLGDATGRRLALQGILTPTSREGGRLDARLTPVTSTGLAPRPIAEVHGAWIVDPEGFGRFRAEIIGRVDEDGEPRFLGRMEGEFADPMRDGKDPVGRFRGRWIVCR